MPEIKGAWEKGALEGRTGTVAPNPPICHIQASWDAQKLPYLKASRTSSREARKRKDKEELAAPRTTLGRYSPKSHLHDSVLTEIVALIFGIKQLDADGLLLLVPIIGAIRHQVDDNSCGNHWLRKVCLKCRRHRRVTHALRPRDRGCKKHLSLQGLGRSARSVMGTRRR